MNLKSIFRSLVTTRFFNLLLILPLLLSLSFTPATPPAEAQAQPENTVSIGAALSALSDSAVQPAALNFTQIAAGWYHTCALTAGGGVKCWGSSWGSGNGSTPVDIVGLASGVTALVAKGGHTCALTAGGGVKCWGANFSGQLGDGTITPRTTPVDVVGLSSGVTALAAGNAHTCAVTAGGVVKCWGDNQATQLGDGTGAWQRTTPVDVVGLASGVTALTAGEYHTCALTAGGGVKCWGWNSSGQMGDGTTTQRPTPVDVSGLASGVVALAAGDYHTCALMDAVHGGGVKCWGSNGVGQLGDGTITQRNTPVDVVGLASGVIALAAGRTHTCAVTAGGGVKCWGDNEGGQLGDGTTTPRSTPVDVSGLESGFAAVAAGGMHTCAVTAASGAKCWGRNDYGQLGDGTTMQRSMPVDVNGLASGVTTLAAGWQHTCVVTAGGGAKCWGWNSSGQLGDGTTTWQRAMPVDVNGLTSGIIALAASWKHTCAVTAGGGVKCWGRNSNGQLGNDSNTSSSTPVDVSGLASGVSALAAGWYHTCALMDAVHGGGVKCWGDNGYGQLGDGTNTQRRTPVDVSGLSSGVTALVAGDTHTCAVMDAAHGGGVKCWGWNSYGQLGDGTNIARSTPVDVSGLSSGVAALAAGSSHTCAATAGGGVKCWGGGTTTPVDVVGLTSGVTALAAGGSHTCALMTGGGVKCWGQNSNGQLGDGTTTQRSTPVNVSGLASGVTVLAAGAYHTCALMAGGGLKCWGSDGSGQLGIGTITQRLTPVEVVEFVSPQLTINYSTGQPGSYFTLTGWNFPVSSTVTISINTYVFTVTVPVNATGSFIFFINTTQADVGCYTVTASVISGGGAHALSEAAASANSSASAAFMLIAGAPLRFQLGGGQTLAVPASIAVPVRSLFLPLVTR